MLSLNYGPFWHDDELRSLAEIMMLALFPQAEREPAWCDRYLARMSAIGDFRAVHRGDALAGGLGIYPMGQWFGGRSVSSGAVTVVAVAVEHRRQGVGLYMMREAIRELAERGMALSVLYPATQPIYFRTGYASAGSRFSYAVPITSLPARATGHTLRPATEADYATLHAIYSARAMRSAGWFDRTPAFWQQRVLTNFRGRMLTYVAERDGVAEGYVVYSQKSDPQWGYDLDVMDLNATTPEGYAALAGFLAGFRSMAKQVLFYGGVNEALLTMLDEQPTGGPVKGRFDWLLRIVNVKSSLESRGYPTNVRAELHFDIADDIVPANNGRVVLTVADGRGEVTAGGDGGLRMDVRTLASMYTGWRTADDLLQTGQCTLTHEGGARTVMEAAAVFAGPHPSMPDFF